MQHPKLHLVNTVCATCGTGHTFMSTAETMRIDVCPGCHPAFTGERRAAQAGTRIDRFNRRLALAG